MSAAAVAERGAPLDAAPFAAVAALLNWEVSAVCLHCSPLIVSPVPQKLNRRSVPSVGEIQIHLNRY